VNIVRIPNVEGRRRGIAGILAAVLLFAMLFTAGMSFFLYQLTLNHQYDQASQYNQKLLGSKSIQQITITSHPVQGQISSASKLSAIISNVGGNSSTIVEFFVRDQTGQLLCLSPQVGSIPGCSTALVSSTNVNVLPSTFSMGIGSNVNLTTGLASNNAQLKNCTVTASCSLNLVTAVGNVFSGTFPLAGTKSVSITTTLNATAISPGHHVVDTAILSGQTSNAGGTVTYSWFTDGACGAVGGSQNILVPPVAVSLGVVPNSAAVKFPSIGYFSFKATYSGDPNNYPATSPCEPLNVAAPGVCVTNLNSNPPVICQATVAQGLGSLAFNFNSFKWYSAGSCAPQGTSGVIGLSPLNSCTLHDGLVGSFSVKNAPSAYTISQTGMTQSGSNLFFSMNVTNVDPSQRTLVIDQYTQLWFSWFCPTSLGTNANCGPGNHGGIATSYYGLVNMSKPYQSNPTTTVLPKVTILYGQNATLFFGLQNPNTGGVYPGIPFCGTSATPYVSEVTPVFIFFHGTVGGIAWGQDFPLAATLWTNIAGSC
jgi:flagellin-like protein